MRSSKKNITIILLLLVLCLVTGIATACVPETETEKQNTPSVTLNKISVTLDLDETLTLLAETQNITGDIVWSSSAPSVATVENGVVKSVSVGSAEITATCGEYSAKCTVTVSCGEKLPILKLDDTEVNLLLNDKFTVQPKLTYNGKTVKNAVFEYSSSNISVATVNGEGCLSGISKGTSTIQVKASWKHFEIYGSFDVNYVSESYIQMNKQSFVLYTSDVFGDKITDTIDLTVVKDGEKVSDPDIEYTYDETALNIENGVISVLKKEDASYNVVATYSDTDEPMSVNFTVKTLYPVRDMQNEYGNYQFEAMSDNLTSSFDCFTDGSLVIGVYDTAAPEDNLVQGNKIVFDTKYYGARTWIVKNSNGYAYKVGGELITKIITTAQEFQDIFMTSSWTAGYGWTTDVSKTYYDGYYVLANDISFGSSTYNDCKYYGYDVSGSDGVPEGSGFNGIFDGRGHTVSNIWLWYNSKIGKTGGIFGTIGVNGVVKNVAFINGGGHGWVQGYLANAIAGTVDNVFLQMDLASSEHLYSQNMGLLTYRLLPTAKISNTVTWLSGSPYGYGAEYSKTVCSFANRIDKGATLSNNYTVATSTGYVAGTTWDKINDSYTVSEIKAYTKAGLNNVNVNKNGFVAEYWDLTDNLLPVMKSSLTLTTPRISIDSTFALSGDEVQINFNSFEHRYLDVESTRGTVDDGGEGKGQTDMKATLDLTDVVNETVTIYLRFAGRTLQTFELAVGGTDDEVATNLGTSVYTLQTWNGSGWSINSSDFVMGGLTQLQGKTVTLAYVRDKDSGSMYSVNVVLDGSKLTVNNATLKELSAGEKEIYIICGSEKYVIGLSLVTAEITTEEQFVSVFLSEWHGMEWTNDMTKKDEMTYDGYYVLGGNIEFSDTYYVNKYRSWAVNNQAIPNGVGFNGVFDGKGYTISNLGVTNRTNYNCTTGIFGTIGKNGVVRNVAFVNGRMEGRTLAGVSSYLAVGITGTLDNVFVHIDLSKCALNREGSFNVIAYGLDGDTNIKNCVAYVSGVAVTDYAYEGQTFGNALTESANVTVAIATYRWNSLSNDDVLNSYLVVDDRLNNGNNTMSGFTVYSETEIKNGATIVTEGFNTYWNLTEYKLPVFTSAKTLIDLDGFKKN